MTDEPITYVWTVVERNDRMGFTKRHLVEAANYDEAITIAELKLYARGYDINDFELIKIERGTKVHRQYDPRGWPGARPMQSP